MAGVRVPYVALGDSLTQGMQSMGLAGISQTYSFPRQIAEFIGAAPFNQPVLKGWLPGHMPFGEKEGWVGNPPNMELVLRRAEAALAAQPNAKTPSSSDWLQLHDQVEAVAAVLREGITDYVHAVDDCDAMSLLAEPRPGEGYQNLGIYGYKVLDVSMTNYAHLKSGIRISFRGQLARLARHAIEGATDMFAHAAHGHASLLQALSLALLASAEHDFGPRMAVERVGYVLGTGSTTALEAARAQHPQVVTLWIGNNDIFGATCDARVWDGDQPLYTLPDVFRQRLADLMDAILNFDSRPALFVATLPSPTSAPNLVRNRLGHWKSMLPSAAFLVDTQLMELETIVTQYNAAIRELAANRAGRVWLVDLHALQERMLRGTRLDAQVTRRVVTHAVRAGHLDPQAAHAALSAANAGNLDTIRHALEVDARLAQRSFTAAAVVPPAESGARLGTEPLTAMPDRTDIDAFVVRLANGQTWRVTGEYLAADDQGEISQGGGISLDAVHLTNTGYSFVAREFLKVIYAADTETRGAVLRGLRGQQKAVSQFDAYLLRVARDDTLLNRVPRLLPAVMDAAGAVADLLGELHYSDPYLSR